MTTRHGIFEVRPDTHPGSPAQRDRDVGLVLEALDDCMFPWWRCIPTLRMGGIDRLPFPIEFVESSLSDGALGYVSARRMWLRAGVTAHTVGHEIAHVADVFTLGTDHRGRLSPNSGSSPWRDELQTIATHHDEGRFDHPHGWSNSRLSTAPWSQQPVEAVTVPWTKHYFTDPRFHYPESRFTRDGHTWDDSEKVAAIFESREIAVFNDEDEVSEAHLESVRWLAERGISVGDADGNFDPGGYVTREQMATFLRRALDRE